MPEPKRRYDGYGQPIAPLVDANQESLAQRPANQDAMAALFDELRTRWAAMLRRGWHGAMTIDIVIRDGIIEKDIHVTVRQACRIRE